LNAGGIELMTEIALERGAGGVRVGGLEFKPGEQLPRLGRTGFETGPGVEIEMRGFAAAGLETGELEKQTHGSQRGIVAFEQIDGEQRLIVLKGDQGTGANDIGMGGIEATGMIGQTLGLGDVVAGKGGERGITGLTHDQITNGLDMRMPTPASGTPGSCCRGSCGGRDGGGAIFAPGGVSGKDVAKPTHGVHPA